MLPQFGEPVPGDLVLMPSIKQPTFAETHLIFDTEWYEYENVLMVSGSAIDWLSESDPLDADIDLSAVEVIDRVSDALKRWDYTDGFYHA